MAVDVDARRVEFYVGCQRVGASLLNADSGAATGPLKVELSQGGADGSYTTNFGQAEFACGTLVEALKDQGYTAGWR